MNSLMSRVHARFGHISDETLAAIISGELGSLHTLRTNAHLGQCWQCRARRDELERAAQLVVEYRKHNLASCLPLDPGPRQSFLALVKEQSISRPRAVAGWPRFLLRLRNFPSTMNPVFASVVVVAIAFVALFWIWQRSVISVSASELLQRAASSDEQHFNGRQTGVLYQQVAVRTGKNSFRHSIYRDLSSRRRMLPVTLSDSEAEVQRKLEVVGVSWDQPLSAAKYKGWRDRQSKPVDEVHRTGNSLLTLTTTLGEGEVAKESLTVREEDFHPVKRIIEMRDQETIEVAELDFAVLGWNAVNLALFERLVPSPAALAAMTPSIHADLPQSLPSMLQIDIAELAVRSALNQINADTQDQIRVTHTDSGVVVKSIVRTNQRKQELIAQLNQIAYVHSEILSTEEMQNRPENTAFAQSAAGGPAQLYSAPVELAPLAVFLQDRSFPSDQLSVSSKQLLDASLKVQRAGAELAELQERFGHVEALPPQSQMRFETLAVTSRNAIEEGLTAELTVLGRIGFPVQDSGDVLADSEDSASLTTLRKYVERNQQYCQELIVAPVKDPRPASMVAADISASVGRIRTVLAVMQKHSPKS
jgi:hypothetical protein